MAPFIWRTLDISARENLSDGFRAGLQSNGQWIRNVITNSPRLMVWLVEAQVCTNLLDLVYWGSTALLNSDPTVNTLLVRNPALQLLHFWHRRCGRLDSGKLSDLAEGLSSLHLTTLRLQEVILDSSMSNVLNHLSSTIKHLVLDDCIFLAEMHSELGPVLNLESPVLQESDSVGQSSTRFVGGACTVLDALSDLRQLTVVTSKSEFALQLPVMLRKSSMALLESLDLELSTDDDKTADVLNATPHTLTELRLKGTRIGPLSSDALCDFVKRSQLTRIDLHECGVIQSETWQTILTSCPFLLELVDDVDRKYSPLDVVDMTKPWVCNGLLSLEIAISVGTGSVHKLQKKSTNIVAEAILSDFDKLFSQLVSLSKLEKLFMIIDMSKSSWSPMKLLGPGQSFCYARFLLLWSKLAAWTQMENFQLFIFMRAFDLDTDELEDMARDMWGDKTHIHIEQRQ